MIKTATKEEVVQVAHDLLDPLLDNVHMDVANVRAELVAEGRARQEQEQRFNELAREYENRIQLLRAELLAFRKQEAQWKVDHDNARQIRQQLKDAIGTLQQEQGRQRSDIARIEIRLKSILSRISEGEQ